MAIKLVTKAKPGKLPAKSKLKQKPDIKAASTPLAEALAEKPAEKAVLSAKAQVALAAILAKEVDALAELELQLEEERKAIAGKAREYAERCDLFLKEADRLANPDQGVRVKGNVYVAEVGARAKHREVTDREALVAAFEKVRPGLSTELAQYRLKDIDAYLTPDEKEALIKEEHSGKRGIKFSVKP